MKKIIVLILMLSNGLYFTGVTYAQFPSYSTIDDLSESQAFAINGTADSGAFGLGASGIGDFNNDGLDDIIIAARTSDPNGGASGACYVVYGSDGILPSNFDISQLNGTNGFAINGVSENDLTCIAVSSAGDVNNDGIDDILIGARGANPDSTIAKGAAYVIYGTESLMPAIFELSSLNGINGFRMVGEAAGDWFGSDVSYIGDVNNDLIDDIMIGALTADNNGSSSGAVYVVFGRSAFPGSIDIGALDGTDGFMFNAPSAGMRLGAVSSAGDFNHDGINDMLMGAYYASPNAISFAGEAYLVYGQDTIGSGINFPATFELSSIDSSTGIVFQGSNENDKFGQTLTYAGDVNHDGIDDVAINAPSDDTNASGSGAVYVIYGTATTYDTPINIYDIDGSNGFVMYGENANDGAGSELAFGGDFNGDGKDDLIIGAPDADTPGTNYGSVYFLYGWDLPFPAAFDMDNLDNSNGFILEGNDNWDRTGSAVSNAGDFNGDGVSDLVVGVNGNDFNGASDGTVFVVFGSTDVIFKNSFD